MLNRAALVSIAAVLVLLGEAVATQTLDPRRAAPSTERIDISAPATSGNPLAGCRVTGGVTLWVSRRVDVVDDMGVTRGAIEAGLAQFARGSILQGCVPDGVVLDLSDRFANFLVADDRTSRSFGRRDAAVLASQLAQDFYRLSEPRGPVIPLVDAITIRALGSVKYRFQIVLISGGSGAMDAVVHRETTATKFAPELAETDRRLTRLKWSSVP